MEPVIRAEGLSRSFNGTVAVEGLGFEIRRGEVFGLLGPNGGGKTTTVRMLCCLLAPTAGTAVVLGQPTTLREGAEYIRQHIGLLPEAPGLYDRLSAYRNLEFYAELHGLPEARRRERIEHLLKLLDVWDRRDDAVAGYSRGMKQKLAIARAVVHNPDIVFLDEPTASLDPEAARTVRELILALRKEGHTVFLNTHNLDEAQRICDRVGILRQRLLAVGSPRELSTRRFGEWTRIELARPSEAVAAAVASMGAVEGVRSEERVIHVRLSDPEANHPELVRRIVSAGGDLVSIAAEERGLEELYLSLVGEAK